MVGLEYLPQCIGNKITGTNLILQDGQKIEEQLLVLRIPQTDAPKSFVNQKA
jgi:hypothetical protein